MKALLLVTYQPCGRAWKKNSKVNNSRTNVRIGAQELIGLQFIILISNQ